MLAEKQKILEKLREKIPSGYKCPVCGYKRFHLMDAGFNFLNIHEQAEAPSQMPIYIPTIMMVCDKCGYISQHVEKVVLDKAFKFDGSKSEPRMVLPETHFKNQAKKVTIR